MKFYKIAFIYCNRKQINDFLGWKDWGRIGRGIIQELPKIVWVIDHDDGQFKLKSCMVYHMFIIPKKAVKHMKR